MKNEFMQFKQLNEEVTELHIYGDIRKLGFFEKYLLEEGEEPEATSAISFKDALKEVKTEILQVRINSSGGMVSEALTIYSQLQDFKGKVITQVDGFAASAASVIFMAGEERIVPLSGLLMIHNAWASGSGNAKEFRKMADDLDKITQPSLDIYAEKTGQSRELIQELMDNETWITSDEAIDLGFATSTTKDDGEQSFQQNAILSLVNENKKLKECLEANGNVEGYKVEIDAKEIAQLVAQELKLSENKNIKENTNESNWLGFFKVEKEK